VDIQTIEERKALNDELKMLGLSIENLAGLRQFYRRLIEPEKIHEK
jgi:hypothetical protein